ncbi:MAG: indole-3-glycerol-phosphate synthase [Nitrososphaerales archaeon]
MADFLDKLAKIAWENVKSKYYDINVNLKSSNRSLKREILNSDTLSLITEIKFSSPLGSLREKENFIYIAEKMLKGGAKGISIITEPKIFKGSLQGFMEVRRNFNIPLLMKDVVVDISQIDCAKKLGANLILLILSLFNRNYTSLNLDSAIGYAHKLGLEVLLETHTLEEFYRALNSEADLIGINNRDLRTLEVNLEQTKKILERVKVPEGKVIVSESGIESRKDIEYLRALGVKAFLVGSSIMKAEDIEAKVKELIGKG